MPLQPVPSATMGRMGDLRCRCGPDYHEWPLCRNALARQLNVVRVDRGRRRSLLGGVMSRHRGRRDVHCGPKLTPVGRRRTMGYPLEGVRVVALEQAVAAPFCTRHLADLGADVVKIERPDGGDFGRRYDTVVNGMSSYFVWLNRGKRSLTLDLKSDGGRTLLTRLLARADVFIQNMGPGVVDRLGLAAVTLRVRYPRLI